jgi:hypothetical protein
MSGERATTVQSVVKICIGSFVSLRSATKLSLDIPQGDLCIWRLEGGLLKPVFPVSSLISIVRSF